MQAYPCTWFGLVLGVGAVTTLEKQSTFSINVTSPELKYDPSSLKKPGYSTLLRAKHR